MPLKEDLIATALSRILTLTRTWRRALVSWMASAPSVKWQSPWQPDSQKN